MPPHYLWGGSFAEYRLFYMALLQKRPIIFRSLLIDERYHGRMISEGLIRERKRK